MTTANGFKMFGSTYSGQAGCSVSSAGDVNGDGFNDLLVGECGGGVGVVSIQAGRWYYSSYPGVAYVIFGRANGSSFANNITLSAMASGPKMGYRIYGRTVNSDISMTGWSVRRAGDINGDGVGDILVGAVYESSTSPATTRGGAAYVIFGRKNSTYASNVNIATMVTGRYTGFRIGGTGNNENIGSAVSAAGDVNGDGVDDFIIGAQYFANFVGACFVFFGRRVTTDAQAFLNVNLATFSFTVTTGFRMNGASSINTGFSVSNAGDVNGDGISDLITCGGDGTTTAHVVFGRNATRGNLFSTNIALASWVTNNSTGFRLTGPKLYSVSTAGDVNGDGIADIIVSAPYLGNAYVIFGRRVYTASTNIYIPFTDVDLTSFTSSMYTGFRVTGGGIPDPQYAELLPTATMVSPAGDVNGDGVGDIIVGFQYGDLPNIGSVTRTNSGISYVLFGRKVTSASNAFTDIVLTTFVSNVASGFVINGPYANAFSGGSVSSAGDINNDGYADVIVGVVQDKGTGTATYAQFGAAYVVYGGNYMDPPTAMPTALPTRQPVSKPTPQPTKTPVFTPTAKPTSATPTISPSAAPTSQPSSRPSAQPSSQPSSNPSARPSAQPSSLPSVQPSVVPSAQPIATPSVCPSAQPSSVPSAQPSVAPTSVPSVQPSGRPSALPSVQPSSAPSAQPTTQPTAVPSGQPSARPSMQPVLRPTARPSVVPPPSAQPSSLPTGQPSSQPSSRPSCVPSVRPSAQPTLLPSVQPTSRPSSQPSRQPSRQPTSQPTSQPSSQPSNKPSRQPSSQPSRQPSSHPSRQPTGQPSAAPTHPLNTGEWTSNLGGTTMIDDLAVVSGGVWMCGASTNSVNSGGTVATCIILDPTTGAQTKTYQLGWDAVTSVVEVVSRGRVYISGRTASSSTISSAVAVCTVGTVGQTELSCTVKSFADTNIVYATYSPYTQRILYVGQTGAYPVATIVDTASAAAIRSYYYTSTSVPTLSLQYAASPPSFVGSMVAGTGGSSSALNTIIAGWINLDTGDLVAMTLSPVSGYIVNSADLVTGLVLEDTGPDSFIVGGLVLSTDSASVGLCAYLLRANALYRRVDYGVRYRSSEGSSGGSSGSSGGRRSLRGTFTPSSVSRGVVRVGVYLYMIADYAYAQNHTAVVVMQVDIATEMTIVNQAAITSQNASISCSSIIVVSSSSTLNIACSVTCTTTATAQAVVISVTQDLSFTRLPVGFTKRGNNTFYAESVPMKATPLSVAKQSAAITTTDGSFLTGNLIPTYRPTTVPTVVPSTQPSDVPSSQPSSSPTAAPSVSARPTSQPSTSTPTMTYKPSAEPSARPTLPPTARSTIRPTAAPTLVPSMRPSCSPTPAPSTVPSVSPTRIPSSRPLVVHTVSPTVTPTTRPSRAAPTARPTALVSSVEQGTTVSSRDSSSSEIVYIALGSVGGALILLLFGGVAWMQYHNWQGNAEKRKRRRAFDDAYKHVQAALQVTNRSKAESAIVNRSSTKSGRAGSATRPAIAVKKGKQFAHESESHVNVCSIAHSSGSIGGRGAYVDTSIVSSSEHTALQPVVTVSTGSVHVAPVSGEEHSSSRDSDDSMFDAIMRDGSDHSDGEGGSVYDSDYDIQDGVEGSSGSGGGSGSNNVEDNGVVMKEGSSSDSDDSNESSVDGSDGGDGSSGDDDGSESNSDYQDKEEER